MRAADGACCRHEHRIERSGARNIGVFTLVERAHYVHASRHMVKVAVVERIHGFTLLCILPAATAHLFIRKRFLIEIQLFDFLAGTEKILR